MRASTSLCFVLLAVLGLPAQEAERPNILFVFTDDHAAHAIGAYGAEHAPTPRLDRLAREGMRFDNCFCTNSICAPSRAVVLTGKHSHVNGVRTNRDRFDGTQPTFPKALRRAGYQTAIVGKWHLKTEPTGFDYWRVLRGQGTYYNPVFRTPEGRERIEGYCTDVVTDLALEWLRDEREPDKPFLLMYQHKAPHRRWAPGPEHLDLFAGEDLPEPQTLFDDYSGRARPARWQEMTIARHFYPSDMKLTAPRNLTPEQKARWDAAYGPRNAARREAGLRGKDEVRWRYQRYIKDYLRCVASVDDNLGRVLDWLEASGLAENTVVVYSSDQGFFLGDHGWYDKRWMYEESLRMPLIVRWPKGIEAGSVEKALVQNIDFAPTFLELAGVPVSPTIQGRSLVPLLRGEDPEDWREAIYYRYFEYPAWHMVRAHRGVRTDRFKLIHYYGVDEWELFDLEADPDELRSVHEDPRYADVRLRLELELEELATRYEDDVPLDGDGPFPPRRPLRVFPSRVVSLTSPGPLPARLDPSGRPFSVHARVEVSGGDQLVCEQLGADDGFRLALEGGRPVFRLWSGGRDFVVMAPSLRTAGEIARVSGILDEEGRLQMRIDDVLVASAEAEFMAEPPRAAPRTGRDPGLLALALDWGATRGDGSGLFESADE